MARRGFAVAGALDHEIIRDLAQSCEAREYDTFWVNDTPNGDGLAALAVAAETTSSISLGVGVIAVDRRPPDEIAQRIRALQFPVERLVLGIGSGRTGVGSLDLVRSAAELLRATTGVPIVVGALGPKMCRLAGETADGVLLNWLTPGAAMRSGELVRTAAEDVGRPRPLIAGYIRAALGEETLPRLNQEAARYERIPQYARHFEAMGVSGVETSATGRAPEDIQASLSAYDTALDETVVRAITAEDSMEDYRALLDAAAP